jgi:pimeloyl-ACP methyl ester carboxylesterase
MVATVAWNLIKESLINLFYLWILSELIFMILIWYAAKSSLNKLKSPPSYGKKNIDVAMRIIKNLERMKSYSLQKFLSGWFCGASFDSIHLENIRSFLSWVMYANFMKNLNIEQLQQIDEVIHYIENTFHHKFPVGLNPNIHHVHMTLEPLRYLPHPLIFYILVGIKNIFTDISLQAMGYQKRFSRGVTYWFRPSPCTNDELTPTVFFHGITTGWSIYALLIQQLSSKRTIFLFELDGIKIHSLNFEMPTPDHYCEVVKRVLDRHQKTKVNLVGHSFGTITTGWFVTRHPSYVSHITLIDPVSLLLSQPEVAFNFLYRKPSTLMEWGIHLAASMEITIANSLRRNFWWYQNELWLEDVDLSIGVHVSLAGGDEVCNSEAVHEYVQICQNDRLKLREQSVDNLNVDQEISDITICYRDGHSHAQVLMCLKSLGVMSEKILFGQKAVYEKGKE